MNETEPQWLNVRLVKTSADEFAIIVTDSALSPSVGDRADDLWKKIRFSVVGIAFFYDAGRMWASALAEVNKLIYLDETQSPTLLLDTSARGTIH